MQHMEKIVDAIWQNGLQITKMKMTLLDRVEADKFYKYLHNEAAYKWLFTVCLFH